MNSAFAQDPHATPENFESSTYLGNAVNPLRLSACRVVLVADTGSPDDFNCERPRNPSLMREFDRGAKVILLEAGHRRIAAGIQHPAQLARRAAAVVRDCRVGPRPAV